MLLYVFSYLISSYLMVYKAKSFDQKENSDEAEE